VKQGVQNIIVIAFVLGAGVISVLIILSKL
jgi:hypothetical protein